MHGEIRNAYTILISKTEGKRPLTRPRHRSKATLKWGIDLESMDWINLAQDTGFCEQGNETLGSVKSK